jgi:hypothetical protein
MLPVTSGEQFRLLRELLALLDPVLSGLPIEERETLMATRHFINTAIDSHTGV